MTAAGPIQVEVQPGQMGQVGLTAHGALAERTGQAGKLAGHRASVLPEGMPGLRTSSAAADAAGFRARWQTALESLGGTGATESVGSGKAAGGAGKPQARRPGTGTADYRDKRALKGASAGGTSQSEMAPDARTCGGESGPGKALTSGEANAGNAGVTKDGSARIAKESETVTGSGSAAAVEDAAGSPGAAGGWALMQPAAVVMPSAAAIEVDGKAGRTGRGGIGMPTTAENKVSAAQLTAVRGKAAPGTAGAGAARAVNEVDGGEEDDPVGAAPKTPAGPEIAHANEGRVAAEESRRPVTAIEVHAANYGSHAGSTRTQDVTAGNETAANRMKANAAAAGAPDNMAMPAQGLSARGQAATSATESARAVADGQGGPAVVGSSGNVAASASAQVPVNPGNGALRAEEAGSTGTATASVRDPFSVIDQESAAPSPTWTQAGARHAEAGYLDPALGWVGVRADAAGSIVHAAIVPGSVEAATALGSHLSALPAYLSEHHGQTASVTLAAPENGFGAAGQGQAGTGAGQNRTPGETAAEQANSISAAAGRDVRQEARSPEVLPAAVAHARGTGELISVIA